MSCVSLCYAQYRRTPHFWTVSSILKKIHSRLLWLSVYGCVQQLVHYCYCAHGKPFTNVSLFNVRQSSTGRPQGKCARGPICNVKSIITRLVPFSWIWWTHHSASALSVTSNKLQGLNRARREHDGRKSWTSCVHKYCRDERWVTWYVKFKTSNPWACASGKTIV